MSLLATFQRQVPSTHAIARYNRPSRQNQPKWVVGEWNPEGYDSPGVQGWDLTSLIPPRYDLAEPGSSTDSSYGRMGYCKRPRIRGGSLLSPGKPRPISATVPWGRGYRRPPAAAQAGREERSSHKPDLMSAGLPVRGVAAVASMGSASQKGAGAVASRPAAQR